MSKLLSLLNDNAPRRPFPLELADVLSHDMHTDVPRTESQSLLLRFDPKRVGFGIVDIAVNDSSDDRQVWK